MSLFTAPLLPPAKPFPQLPYEGTNRIQYLIPLHLQAEFSSANAGVTAVKARAQAMISAQATYFKSVFHIVLMIVPLWLDGEMLT